MNKLNKNTKQNTHTGHTLIEMMVVIVISLLLITALIQLLIGSMQMSRTATNLSRMQESGRVALDLMGRAVRNAGARINITDVFTGAAITGSNGANGASDSITLQYLAQEEGALTCTGATVPSGTLITSTFSIANIHNTSALTCNGEVLVDNVEGLQITYGLDPNKSGSISTYTSSPTQAEFNQVAAVSIILIIRSPNAGMTSNNTQTYVLVADDKSGDATLTNKDGYLRQIYRSTFTVRNQAA